MVESCSSGRLSAHQLFGGGSVADIVLWRRWPWSVLVLISSTSVWLLFERGDYNLPSFIVNVLLLVVIILFFWAKSASLLNRPLPLLPDLEIPDASVDKAVQVLRVLIDRTLWIVNEIAVFGNLQVLVQVAISLSIISVIGSLTDFITFVYIGVLLCLSLPVFYENYQEPVDEVLYLLWKIVRVQWRNFDKNVLCKIPVPAHREKKSR
ncbi:hypothetical protein V2J09_010366 [Rumex salicifolius]